jgi:hypothetical protein
MQKMSFRNLKIKKVNGAAYRNINQKRKIKYNLVNLSKKAIKTK